MTVGWANNFKAEGYRHSDASRRAPQTYPGKFSPLLRRSNGIPQPSVLMVRHRAETREQHAASAYKRAAIANCCANCWRIEQPNGVSALAGCIRYLSRKGRNGRWFTPAVSLKNKHALPIAHHQDD
jgi:hypothetical protein